jgi:hypothetical protein
MNQLTKVLAVLLALGSMSLGKPADNNAVVPGEFIVEPPTLMNLGFEWKIQGDDNHNATVTVQYRKKGQNTRNSRT